MTVPNMNRAARERKALGARRVDSRRAFTLLEMLAVMTILSLIMVSLFTMFRQGTETWRLSAARTEAYLKARQILEMMSREIKGAVLITAPRGPNSEPNDPLPKRADFRGLNGDNPGSGSSSNSVTLQGWRDQTSGSTIEQRYSDQVYFVTPVTNSGKQELCMIGYYIKDVDGDTAAPPTPYGVPRKSKDDKLWRVYQTDGLLQGGVAAIGDPNDQWRAFDFSSRRLNSGDSMTGEVALSVRQLDIKYYDYDANGVLREYNAWDSRPFLASDSPEARQTTPLTNDDDNKLPVAVKITVTVGDKDDIIKGIRLSTVVYLENAGRR